MTVRELEAKLTASEYMDWIAFYQQQEAESEKPDEDEVDWSTADLQSIFNLEK